MQQQERQTGYQVVTEQDEVLQNNRKCLEKMDKVKNDLQEKRELISHLRMKEQENQYELAAKDKRLSLIEREYHHYRDRFDS